MSEDHIWPHCPRLDGKMIRNEASLGDKMIKPVHRFSTLPFGMQNHLLGNGLVNNLTIDRPRAPRLRT